MVKQHWLAFLSPSGSRRIPISSTLWQTFQTFPLPPTVCLNASSLMHSCSRRWLLTALHFAGSLLRRDQRICRSYAARWIHWWRTCSSCQHCLDASRDDGEDEGKQPVAVDKSFVSAFGAFDKRASALVEKLQKEWDEMEKVLTDCVFVAVIRALLARSLLLLRFRWTYHLQDFGEMAKFYGESSKPDPQVFFSCLNSFVVAVEVCIATCFLEWFLLPLLYVVYHGKHSHRERTRTCANDGRWRKSARNVKRGAQRTRSFMRLSARERASAKPMRAQVRSLQLHTRAVFNGTVEGLGR